jgi:crotonobetainyl-CoA:carnitine CoA-transferase CaiB-like acyl-CoA transferase
VLFMASEQAFWKNFCAGVDRIDLFEKWPGKTYGDHAKDNIELQGILTEIFGARSSAEWIVFGNEHNTPIAPVNTPRTILDDPQFQHRMTWMPKERHDADMMAYPIKVEGGELPEPRPAPSPGEHGDEVLREIAGYDDAKLAALREAGALG